MYYKNNHGKTRILGLFYYQFMVFKRSVTGPRIASTEYIYDRDYITVFKEEITEIKGESFKESIIKNRESTVSR